MNFSTSKKGHRQLLVHLTTPSDTDPLGGWLKGWFPIRRKEGPPHFMGLEHNSKVVVWIFLLHPHQPSSNQRNHDSTFTS